MRALALALQSKCPIATLSGCLDPLNVRPVGAFSCAPKRKTNLQSRREFHEKTCSCCRNRSCRQYWLCPAVSHCSRRHARPRSARYSPTARTQHAGKCRSPQGRDDGIGRLCFPASCRHDVHSRPDGRLQGCRRCDPCWCSSAHQGHGTLRTALCQRRHLHRTGQSARRCCQP